jgi:hypothetical protein
MCLYKENLDTDILKACLCNPRVDRFICKEIIEIRAEHGPVEDFDVVLTYLRRHYKWADPIRAAFCHALYGNVI